MSNQGVLPRSQILILNEGVIFTILDKKLFKINGVKNDVGFVVLECWGDIKNGEWYVWWRHLHNKPRKIKDAESDIQRNV